MILEYVLLFSLMWQKSYQNILIIDNSKLIKFYFANRRTKSNKLNVSKKLNVLLQIIKKQIIWND